MSSFARVELDRYLRDEGEEPLMRTLHGLLTGRSPRDKEGHPPFKKGNGNWQLDSSNDWWAWLEGDTLVIHYRYGQDRLDAYATWVRYLMGRAE